VSKTSFAKDKLKILLLEGVHQRAVTLFKKNGYSQIEYHHTGMDHAELMDKIADVHFLGIRSRTQLSAELLAAAKRLVSVGCFCIGTNHVALTAAQKQGIPVFNAPFSNTRSVAELIIAEIIMLMRDIPRKNSLLHKQQWLKSAKDSFEIRGKCLGIIGYGHIGTQLGILAENLGMQVLFYDIEPKLALGNAKACASLTECLQQADVVSLHVPETQQTKNMIDRQALSQMRQGALLLNASRGSVVDLDALHEALTHEHLRGAAIDVFPQEPKDNQDVFVSPLQAFDNVILTPHIGGSTQEAQANIGEEVAYKMLRYSNNGSTDGAVNFPQVSLPEHPGKCRILHIHKNIPGILSQINTVFSSNQINIASQYLQTNADIGYVVMDLDNASGDLALEKLKAITGTIRTRLLY
jgi:D-3-phosphoglycerate dehydrogenase / 2-oxoglutarate reductase